MRGALFSLLLCVAGLSQAQQLETIYDPATKIQIGSRDNDRLADRIEEPQSTSSMEMAITEDFTVLKSIGLAKWGVVQVAAYLREYPSLKDTGISGPFCEIGGQDVQVTKQADVNIDKSTFIYDFEISENFVYILNGASNLLAVEVTVVARNNKDSFIGSNFTINWSVKNLKDISTAQLGSQFSEVCMAHNTKNNAIYLMSDVGLMKLDIATKSVTAAGVGVYQSYKGVKYCDILQDYMFVAFNTFGIYVYNMKDPNAITLVGVMDSSYFLKSVGATLDIRDFTVHTHLVEVMNAPVPAIARANQTPEEIPIFASNLYSSDYINQVAVKKNETSLMFVAEKEKIYVIDLSKIFTSNTLAGTLLPKSIPYQSVERIKRYDTTMVAFFHISSSSTVKSFVSEIFIKNTDPAAWRSTSTKDDELFEVNTEVPFYDKVTNVFIDDKHFYAVMDSRHFIYERGVPSIYGLGNFRISNQFVEKDVKDMAKFLINGEDYVVTIGSNHIANIEMVRSDPYLVCPRKGSKPPTGKYLIDLNVTTRSCPAKMGLRNQISQAVALSKMCRWSMTIAVDYQQVAFYQKPSIVLMVVLILVGVVLLAILGIVITVIKCRKVKAEHAALQAQLRTNTEPVQRPFEPANLARQGTEVEDLKSTNEKLKIGKQEQNERAEYGNID